MMLDLGNILLGSLQRAPWGWALTGMVAVALIKVWPVLALQAIEARDRLRKERRDDLSDCQRRLDVMSKEMTQLREDFHHLEMKLLGSLSAYRILDAEVEAELPGSTALSQARAVMSAAFSLSPSTAAAIA